METPSNPNCTSSKCYFAQNCHKNAAPEGAMIPICGSVEDRTTGRHAGANVVNIQRCIYIYYTMLASIFPNKQLCEIRKGGVAIMQQNNYGSLGLFHLHVCLCWYTCGNVCSCGEHKTGGTTKVIWKHCTCTTRGPHTSHFPHFTSPAKSSGILMDPYRAVLLQALFGSGLNPEGKNQGILTERHKNRRHMPLDVGGNGRGVPNQTRVRINWLVVFFTVQNREDVGSAMFGQKTWTKSLDSRVVR